MIKTEQADDDPGLDDVQATVRLVDHPAWLALRDAHLRALVERLGNASRESAGSATGANLAASLAAIPDARAPAPAQLHALGFDLGRHVASKRVVGDDLREVVAGTSGELEALGLARLTVATAFLRRASVTLEPLAGTGDADPAVLDAYAAGALQGAASTALNARVEVRRTGPHRLDLHLLAGRDVNLEGTFHG